MGAEGANHPWKGLVNLSGKQDPKADCLWKAEFAMQTSADGAKG